MGNVTMHTKFLSKVSKKGKHFRDTGVYFGSKLNLVLEAQNIGVGGFMFHVRVQWRFSYTGGEKILESKKGCEFHEYLKVFYIRRSEFLC